MIDQNFDINEIIIRYLDRSATQEEKITLLQWLKQSENNRTDFTTTKDLWMACEVATDNELEVEIALERFLERILDERNRISPAAKRKIIPLWAIAAVITLLIGLNVTYFFITTKNANKTEVVNQLITANKSKGSFTLPDGTIVWLNSDSRLIYDSNYAKGRRKVRLEGEAYFEVRKNPKSPFTVDLGKMQIEVLGTHFNVSCIEGNDVIKTALLSGSIKIRRDSQKEELLMSPNELYTFSKATGNGRLEKVEAQLYANWIKDELIFDRDKLSDIIISLEGWYGVSISCPESFAEKTRLSFTVRGESIDEIFSAIEMIIPIRYSILGKQILIKPK